MPRKIHPLVKDANDFYAIFDKNVENQMLVDTVSIQPWHNFMVFLIQIGRVIGNLLTRFHQLVIVKISLVFRPCL